MDSTGLDYTLEWTRVDLDLTTLDSSGLDYTGLDWT